jgi:hypothetical protein
VQLIAYERFILLALVATGVLGVAALLLPAQKGAGPVSATGSGSSGLLLNLSINGSSFSQGQSVEVSITETNSLSSMNNATAAQNWGTTFSLGRCSANYPFGIALLKGYYTLQNFSLGEKVSLQSPVQNYMCVRPPFSTNYYHFLPNSDRAVVQVDMGNQTVTSPMEVSIPITGYWTAEGSFTPLQHGTYTLVAGDEWGGLALLRFTVN